MKLIYTILFEYYDLFTRPIFMYWRNVVFIHYNIKILLYFQAVMCISKPHSDIYLVLRIDKVLQGGIVRVSEPYVKATTNNKESGLKVFKSVKNICHR